LHKYYLTEVVLNRLFLNNKFLVHSSFSFTTQKSTQHSLRFWQLSTVFLRKLRPHLSTLQCHFVWGSHCKDKLFNIQQRRKNRMCPNWMHTELSLVKPGCTDFRSLLLCVSFHILFPFVKILSQHFMADINYTTQHLNSPNMRTPSLGYSFTFKNTA
jgi:hypothetical protein